MSVVELYVTPTQYAKYSLQNETRNPTDSGFDLYFDQDYTVKHGEVVTVGFGLAVPSGDIFDVLPRSSISKTPFRVESRIFSEQRYDMIRMSIKTTTSDSVAKEGTRLFQLVRRDLSPFAVKLHVIPTLKMRVDPEFASQYSILPTKPVYSLPIYMDAHATLAPGVMTMVGTGVHVEAADEYKQYASYLRYYPVSKDTMKTIRQSNFIGVIDAGYRGQLMVPMDYFASCDTKPKSCEGMYANLYLGAGIPFIPLLVDVLSETVRGSDGFGSTGGHA